MRILFFSFLISLISLFCVSLVARSFLTSVAISEDNLFTTSSEFATSSATITPTEEQSLVINEVSPVGGDSLDWIELFNGSNLPMDVSGWKLTDNNETDVIPPTAPIPVGGYAIIVASNSSTLVTDSSLKIQLNNNLGNGLNPNSDKVVIQTPDNTVVDALSWGSNSSIFNPGIDVALLLSGKTISRSPNGYDTNNISDWTILTSTLGVSN